MRLITRSDFDGLFCAVLLNAVETIDSIEFVHPKDVQDGAVAVTSNDILTNLPYDPKCGMWFDHHSSEATRPTTAFQGRFAVAPSAAHVVFDHYVKAGKGAKLRKYKKILEVVDKADSAQLTMKDVVTPRGWMLLSYVMDPRTGLGYQHDYAISNRDLMAKMIRWIPEMPVTQILKQPDVVARVKTYFADQEAFKKLLVAHSRMDKNMVVTDLRGVTGVPAGNRFLVYTLFPKCNISVRVFDGKTGVVVVTLGHNIFRRNSKTDCGKLMARYGGGGHRGAGACQIESKAAGATIKKILASIKRSG
jgi:hypothetical protein